MTMVPISVFASIVFTLISVEKESLLNKEVLKLKALIVQE